MGVLEALGGWQNVNQEKLEQIKVDNPPLYNAISKALNLLAKKFGGEDIIIQKPIEVVEEVVPTTQRGQLTDYQILKKIEILSMAKGDWPTRMQILDSFIYEIGFDENEIGAIGDFEQDFYAKLADLVRRDLLLKEGIEYQVSDAGQALINSYELQNKQVEEISPSDEDLKLEILLRMTDYYDGGDYKLLNQDDIITNGVKHQFDIPSNKYFGLVVKLLGDKFVEKDPSGLTDSISLTNKGYYKAMDWFEENLPEEGVVANQYDFPEERQDQVWIAVYDAERNFDRFVTLDEIYNELLPNLPANYPKSGISGEPTLEKDLQILEGNNLVIRRLMTLPKIGAEYAIDPRQIPLISVLKMKRAKAQQQKASSLRPSPSESATLFPTGRVKVGNDGNLWKVTETKNGVKRWTKVGDIPSDEPVVGEPPISEITEDEVDLDLLEQQLNDDSLEFDLNEEDLDNLEF